MRFRVTLAVLSFCACDSTQLDQLTTGNPLETKGALPDPMPDVPRRERSPLDSIAPEDPPIPNRGLVAYLGYPAKSVTQSGNNVFTTGGLPGGSIGYGLFGHQFGNAFASRGSPITYTNLGVSSFGWTVAFQVAFQSTADATSRLVNLRFNGGDAPLSVSINAATGIVELLGERSVKPTALTPITSTDPLQTNDASPFHHMALVFSPFDRTNFSGRDAGILHFYVNGSRVYSQPTTRSALAEVEFDPNPPADAKEALTVFDEVFIYRTSLSETEIRAVQDKPKRGLARVWPVALPVDVKESGPYVQTRSNASNSVVGTYAVQSPTTEVEFLGSLEFGQADTFTITGWYYFPDQATEDVDFFAIDVLENSTKDSYLKLGARNGLPYVTMISYPFNGADTQPKGTVDVVTAGDAWPMQPGSWHFVSVTREPQITRLWLDGNVVGEGKPTNRFTFPLYDFHFIKYGSVPMAWTAAYGRALKREELESLRSPGPRVWLDGTNAERQVSAAISAIGASGFTGPLDNQGTQASGVIVGPSGVTGATGRIVTPNDYGNFCRYNKDTNICDPLVTYGGEHGASVGRDGSIRLSKAWSGRVQIEAPPVLQGSIGASFEIFLEPNKSGFYPIFVRDVPDQEDAWSLPWDVRADAACDQKACALRVFYAFDGSASRKWFDVPMPSGVWTRIALSYDGISRPEVAIDGVIKPATESDGSVKLKINDIPGLFPAFSSDEMAKRASKRIRFGWDIREWWFTALGPYDIDDIRVYSRKLTTVELLGLTQTCAQADCDVSRRACREGNRQVTPACTSCTSTSFVSLQNSPDSGARDMLCDDKRTFSDICVADLECGSGACQDRQCSTRTQAEAKLECDARFRNTKQQTADRFTCGGCNEYFVPREDSTPTDACLWKPPHTAFALIGFGSNGIKDQDSTPGFDTYACDSGHAVTTMETAYRVEPDIHFDENQQSSASFMLSTNPAFHHANLRVTPGHKEERTRCTPSMPDGCEECRKNPALSYCTAAFKKTCQTVGCKTCEDEGQRCNLSVGYPICERCRANFVPRRSLMTPEACQTVYKSMHSWQSGHSSSWNRYYAERLFARKVTSTRDLKVVLDLGFDDFQRTDMYKLEKKGIGLPYINISEALRPVVHNSPGYEAKYNALTQEIGRFTNTPEAAKGRSLSTADCVVTSSAFFGPANDEQCFAKRNPNGAQCPPTNPTTGAPETGDANMFCESGYCGRRLGLCTDGGNPGAEAAKKSGNDSSSSGFSLGIFGVVQTNETTLKQSGSGGKRAITGSLTNKLELKALGISLPTPIYDFTARIESQAGEEASVTPSFRFFGVEVGEEVEPVTSCSRGSWDDENKWQGAECKLGIDVDNPRLPMPTIQKCFSLAGDDDSPTRAPVAKNKFKVGETFWAGPVPILVEAEPIAEVCVGIEAGFSAGDLEASIGFKPSFGVGVEVFGGVGFPVIKAGVKASVVALELGLPIKWVMTVEQEQGTEGTGARFSIISRGDISLTMDILKLSLSLFAEVDLWLFSVEWELTIVQFNGFNFNKQIYGGPKKEFVLDLGN